MAFGISNLALIGHANGHLHYHYKSTADTLATIRASGYFGQDSTTGQQAAAMLTAGDSIAAEGTDGFQVLRVDTVSGNTVTTEVGFGESQVVSVPIMTLSTSGGVYVPAPFDGVIGRVKAVTNGEVDNVTTITIHNAAGATAATIALDQSGQGAGEVYETSASSNNTVSEGDAVQVTWDGGVSAALQATEVDVVVTIEFVPL